MELSKYLLERILNNLGFYKSGFKNEAVTQRENTLNKKISFEEEDGKINSYDVFAAECRVDNTIKVIASDIGTGYSDLTVVIIQDETTLVLKYSWAESDNGCFFVRHEDKWVDMTIMHQLNLTSAIEMITQNGFVWTPVTDKKEAHSIFVEILSEHEK